MTIFIEINNKQQRSLHKTKLSVYVYRPYSLSSKVFPKHISYDCYECINFSNRIEQNDIFSLFASEKGNAVCTSSSAPGKSLSISAWVNQGRNYGVSRRIGENSCTFGPTAVGANYSPVMKRTKSFTTM